MALPDRIEILPLSELPIVRISVPGSKSETNRALILAALAEGITELNGALWSEDTQIMVECLKRLGFDIRIAIDPDEPANRTLKVTGLGGRVPTGGSREKPTQLYVANAGTAARFLTAMVCLGKGSYRLDGVERMRERPQSGLFQALRKLGYQLDSENDRLPVTVHTNGPLTQLRSCQVDVSESSQFASALHLCARHGNWDPMLKGGESGEVHPYIEMTLSQIQDFPSQGGTVFIEPDASSSSYFWGLDALFSPDGGREGKVELKTTPRSTRQVDSRFPDFLPLPGKVSRSTDLGDSIMTAIALAPLKSEPTMFTELQRLRVQECERVLALRTELTKMGAKVLEKGESLEVFPGALHGAEIETYNDHRMAMCFGMLGVRVPGVILKNPSCVLKTFPNFFQKLSSLPPDGLGVRLKDPDSGEWLNSEDAVAEAG